MKSEDFAKEARRQDKWREILAQVLARREKFTLQVTKKNEVQSTLAKSIAMQIDSTKTTPMAEQVEKWTNLKTNSMIVKREKEFKRLIFTKMQSENNQQRLVETNSNR